MTKKQYFVTHSAGCVHCDSISRELESGSFEELTYQDIVDRLNENEQLKQQVQNIHKLIDNKIDEFKNGDYGDLPCNTIHMFLDLKQELGDDGND